MPVLLYRDHYLTRALEERFIEHKLLYRIYSGIAFYSRREIKDVIAYLRMVTLDDDLAFRRTVNLPARKIGAKKVQVLEAYAEQYGLTLYEAMLTQLDAPLLKGTQARRYASAINAVREQPPLCRWTIRCKCC